MCSYGSRHILVNHDREKKTLDGLIRWLSSCSCGRQESMGLEEQLLEEYWAEYYTTCHPPTMLASFLLYSAQRITHTSFEGIITPHCVLLFWHWGNKRVLFIIVCVRYSPLLTWITSSYFYGPVNQPFVYQYLPQNDSEFISPWPWGWGTNISRSTKALQREYTNKREYPSFYIHISLSLCFTVKLKVFSRPFFLKMYKEQVQQERERCCCGYSHVTMKLTFSLFSLLVKLSFWGELWIMSLPRESKTYNQEHFSLVSLFVRIWDTLSFFNITCVKFIQSTVSIKIVFVLKVLKVYEKNYSLT